ncbi:MAG: universal stress protein [Puniceicoccaceae bacterium]
MKRFKRMLVFLHGTPSDLTLIRYVANFAMLCESERILWVMKQPSESSESESATMYPTESKLATSLALSADASASSVILRISETVALQSPSATRLSTVAAHDRSDLILANAGTFPASETETLITGAPCSILWVNPSATPHFRKIMVPVNFSSSCVECVQIGANLAKTRKINHLFLFHSVRIPLSWYRQNSKLAASTELLTESAHHKMRALSAQVDSIGVDCTWRVATANQTCAGIRHFEEQLQPDLMILSHNAQRNRRASPTVMRILNTTHTPTLIFRQSNANQDTGKSTVSALANAA